jgi:DNA repair protein RadA/Sms
MSKNVSTIFVCQECGYESPKWMGQCICGAWNSFVEEKAVTESKAIGAMGDPRSRSFPVGNSTGKKAPSTKFSAEPTRLRDVSTLVKDRIDTGIGELNRVLGGGIVQGSLTLIAGEPGIGKSTLILQTALNLARAEQKVYYVTGEESDEQIRLRADRLAGDALDESTGIPSELYIMSETDLDSITSLVAEAPPAFLIVDSIQTMYTEALDSTAGTVSQVRACTGELMRIAKAAGVPIFIVAHVTKSGELAGPKIIEHLVDCVLQFTGDRNQDLRILRANKNRFGTTSEIGAFEMREEGLTEVSNLSGSLLEGMEEPTEGAVATAVYEGTRPLLLEIQALTAAAGVGFARRTPLGVELARLNMIIAVLERKAKLDLSSKDVYVNVVGGIRPEGTSFDLAVAAAIYSSAKGIAVPSDTLVIGEIGLTGELRSVKGAEKIIREASKLGFKKAILPKRSAEKLSAANALTLIGVSTIKEALNAL